VLRVRTTTPEYKGFRVAFASGTTSPSYACAGGGGIPFSRGCFKSPAFDVPSGDDFATVSIPFNMFSDKWSSATGEQTTTCADDSDVCPTADKLAKIQRVEVWAEGADGEVHLEVLSITAALASTTRKQAAGVDVTLVSFSDVDGAVSSFTELNDPVMGGQSVGTWEVNGTYGIFDGEVKDVPSLSAPGFIKAAADGTFNDASAAIDGDLVLTVRTTTPEYKGFRVSFAAGTTSAAYACSGGGGLPFSRGCFKAQFDVPEGDDFVEVSIPFNKFSDKWSSATGEQTTTCADDSDVCPTADKLAKIERVEVWAEGVDGAIHLEVSDIRAVSAAAATPAAPSVELVPDEYMTCSGAVQDGLRYNMSSRTQAYGLAVPVDDGESLAEAVCCDSRVKPYAEPQYTYYAPDIMMYEHLDESGITTFYDSVCGLPLFVAPMNRTLDEFKADTDEHGWPSFRQEEVVEENVVTDEETGYVTSACGTHLGSYLPDAEGARWCIDLSCVSGNPVAVN